MAVRIDANADRLSYTAASPPATFTLTAWVYLSGSRDTWSTIAQLRDAFDDSVAELAITWDGVSGLEYWDGTGSIDNATSFVVGEWRKVAMTRTGSTGEVYAATKLGATEYATGTVSTETPTQLTLGAAGPDDTPQWFNGRLAYVRIWDSVLSQSDIEAEWLSETPVITSGLWADWPLADDTDLTDTANARTLTVAAGGVLTTEDGPAPGVANRAFALITNITSPATDTTISINCKYIVLDTADLVVGTGVATATGIGFATTPADMRTAVVSACRTGMGDDTLEVQIIGDVGD